MPNRKERRRIAKTMNTPQKMEALVDRLVYERTKDLKKQCDEKLVGYIEVFVVMTCYILEAEDIEIERIPQIASRILFNIDSFRTGELSTDDYEVIKKQVQEWGVKLD